MYILFRVFKNSQVRKYIEEGSIVALESKREIDNLDFSVIFLWHCLHTNLRKIYFLPFFHILVLIVYVAQNVESLISSVASHVIIVMRLVFKRWVLETPSFDTHIFKLSLYKNFILVLLQGCARETTYNVIYFTEQQSRSIRRESLKIIFIQGNSIFCTKLFETES